MFRAAFSGFFFEFFDVRLCVKMMVGKFLGRNYIEILAFQLFKKIIRIAERAKS